MKSVAFIPIKLNNERTPGKNIKLFSDGTPLMHFVQASLLRLKGKKVLDEVYCFCSDEAVKPYLLEGVTFLCRPKELDQKETKGRQIYENFVEMVDSDIYVLAHATSPFVTTAHIEECIKKVRSGTYDSAFCGQKHQAFFWKNNSPLNFDLSNPLRTQDMEPLYTEVTTPYVFTKETFQKYHARTGINPYICECSGMECIDIDYPEDFEMADALYTYYLKGDRNEQY